MRILEENANNDLFMGSNNQLGVLTGLEATLQACASAVETQRGELQYNVERGVPTQQTIWAGVPNQQRFQFYAIEAIKGVEGVQSIQEFNTEIIDDALSYEAIIVTVYGTGTIGNLF